MVYINGNRNGYDEKQCEEVERMKRSEVTNKSGLELDFESAISCMDDDLREALNYNLAPCTDQEFFTAYGSAHEEKFGEEWLLSQSNPTW